MLAPEYRELTRAGAEAFGEQCHGCHRLSGQREHELLFGDDLRGARVEQKHAYFRREQAFEQAHAVGHAGRAGPRKRHCLGRIHSADSSVSGTSTQARTEPQRACDAEAIRGWRLLELAVANEDLTSLRERARQPLGQIYRAMLASRAADGDGEVIAIVAGVFGKPAGDEMMDVGV